MIQKSIPEIEKQVVRLVEYFLSQPDGSELLWENIEIDTAIPMNQHGRSLVRRALKKIKRPYEPVRAVGIILSSPKNAMAIVGHKFVRIDNAVRRADRTRNEISVRHLDALEERDKAKMRVLAGFFGAVRAFAKEAKVKILHQPPEKKPSE